MVHRRCDAVYRSFFVNVLHNLQHMKHLKVFRAIIHVAQTGSIRRAASTLNITSSALNRQIQDFEEELGTPIFERIPKGVRLNTVGELLVQHIRGSLSDFERFQSQVADLSGMRRGHVTIAASQAFANRYLPAQIRRYREAFPHVSFAVKVQDYAAAQAALSRHEVDLALALVLSPDSGPDFLPLYLGTRSLIAVTARDHPLAGAGPVRLRDCLRHPLALPDESLAGRRLFDEAVGRSHIQPRVEIESSSLELIHELLLREPMVSFQIADELAQRALFDPALQGEAIVDSHSPGLVVRRVDPRDAQPAWLVLGQLRGRVLPVAAAKFGEQLARDLNLTPHG